MSRRAEERREAKLVIDNSEGSEGRREGEDTSPLPEAAAAACPGKVLEYSLLAFSQNNSLIYHLISTVLRESGVHA